MKFVKKGKAPAKSQPTHNKGKSKAQAVVGYEKRKAKQASSRVQTDIYEHIPEKSRRSRVGLELDRDEELDFGAGIDDASEEQRESLRARLIGENEDDEKVGSENDEEIDSDDAFDEADDDRFAGFFSAKKPNKSKAKQRQNKSTVRFAEVDLNEDDSMSDAPPIKDGGSESEEEEEEEGDEAEFISLIDVLDGKGDIDMGSDDEKTSKSKSPSVEPEKHHDEDLNLDSDDASHDDSDDGSQSGESDSDEEEDESMSIAPSDDEVQPEALDQLQSFISTLDPTTKKRKAPEGEEPGEPKADARAHKRRLKSERTEAGAENEFRVNASGSKLDLDDLLAPLASQSSTLQTLKKSTKLLTNSKAKTLSAPLPTRTQERFDRQAAYEQTKEEVDKWSSTMKRIQDAEHLSFPLQAPSAARVSNLELTAKFKPTTPMESAVDALLKSAKLRDDDIQETENTMLKMNNLSVEEVAQRRTELRKMRELMFRAEVKAKRVNKIKSKTYRRIKRKEKERLASKIDDPEDEEDEETRLKHEYERAKERATLRHKHTGQWARNMKNRGDLDEDSRKDIEEMLSRGDKLRRRIKGVGSDESGDEDDEDDEDDDDMDVDESLRKIKQDAFDELQRIQVDGGPQEEEGKKGKSVFEMKFMKDAMTRKEHAVRESIDALINELGEGQEGDNVQEDPSGGVVAERRNGRVVYRPGPSAHLSISRALPSLASDTSSVTLKSTDLLSPPPPSPTITKQRTFSQAAPVNEDSNPWLARGDGISTKVAKQHNEVVISKDSKVADKSKHKLKKQAQKRGDVISKAQDDATVDIDPNAALTIARKTPSTSKLSAPTTTKIGPSAAEDDDSDANSEVEAQEEALTLKGKRREANVKAFEQRDLVALAFAGDNVVQKFEEAKKREIESDAPKEVDTTIPGWGSWGGIGLRKAPPKPERIKTIKGIDPRSRADYDKKNIIISEKRDKKASKYVIKDLPYPYTSKAQFERSMDQPLGVEWNTRVAFQRATLPRVVKKPGVVITPLEKLAQ